MEIILMRHYKVDIHFSRHYTSEEFDKACLMYNEKDVIPQSPPKLPPYTIYASQMRRAQQTAQLAFSQVPKILDGVHEVTMRSFMDTRLRLPKWIWELMGRLQWRMQSTRPYETHMETMNRLDSALQTIEDSSQSSIIVMHGLVMRYMVKLLRRRGFTGPTIVFAPNGACYRYSRK